VSAGDLYVADVGAGLWEEIDYLPRAQLAELVNYGWDVYEGNVFKEEKAPAAQGRLVFPVHVYGHDSGCSVTGGFVYRGTAVPVRAGEVLLRRLLQQRGLEPAGPERDGDRRAPRALQRPGSVDVRGGARGELYAASHAGRI